LLRHFLFRPRVRSAGRDRWISVTEYLRKDALQLFAFGGVIARGFRRRPVFEHHLDRLILEYRVQLEKPVEPHEPHRLCGVFVTPVAH
jgi:hypothetical protein